ncbi:MAG TPA: hypothetical protein VLV76_25000, partial [Candidatus Acidoferrum sp.]|nr:hypothetical protein [Candidatus Acidoferrum sp.]
MDSGWIKELRGAGTPFFLVCLLIAIGLAVFWRYSDEPFEHASRWANAAVVALAMVVLAQGVWIAQHMPIKLPAPLASWSLRRRYKKLTEQQRTILRSAFQRGSRHFRMFDTSTNARWFEELEELGYVQMVKVLIVSLGENSSTPCEVTGPLGKPCKRWRTGRPCEPRSRGVEKTRTTHQVIALGVSGRSCPQSGRSPRASAGGRPMPRPARQMPDSRIAGRVVPEAWKFEQALQCAARLARPVRGGEAPRRRR